MARRSKVNKELSMTGAAKIAKHPLHPMLVPIPLGLWIFSLVCDLIYAFGWGGVSWNGTAFYTMAGGLVGALLAAVPGMIDYRALTVPRVKRLAMAHMIINLTVVALFAINLGLRLQYPPDADAPIILSVIGVLLLGLSGWLGGELVYIYGVAVEPQPETAPKEHEREGVV
jgi:uncharacterized membrane protein